MLHTKSQGHRPSGSGEEDFKLVLPYMSVAHFSARKHLSNTNLSDLSIVGTLDIFVYQKRHQII